MSKKNKRGNARSYKAQPISAVTLAQLGGDHGTGTNAAMAGKKLKPITDIDGRNPNNIGRVATINVLDGLTFLSMRQFQAGQEIQRAWLGVEQLSSGGELKEQVDSTPRPAATIAHQIDAQSRYVAAMKPVPKAMREVVEHVCCLNVPLRRLKGARYCDRQSELQVALDLVANRLKY